MTELLVESTLFPSLQGTFTTSESFYIITTSVEKKVSKTCSHSMMDGSWRPGDQEWHWALEAAVTKGSFQWFLGHLDWWLWHRVSKTMVCLDIEQRLSIFERTKNQFGLLIPTQEEIQQVESITSTEAAVIWEDLDYDFQELKQQQRLSVKDDN